MLGDRFRKKLPRFIGEIPDFNDLFIAEDKEFSRLDKRIEQVVNNGYLIDLVDDETLDRLSSIFNVYGSKTSRIARIKAKLTSNTATTVERIEDLGNEFSDVDHIVKVYEHNEDYYFVVEFLINKGTTDYVGFIKALKEIKPAHLDFSINLLIKEDIIYIDKTKNYRTKFWKLNEVPSGRIPTESYKAFKNVDKVILNNKSKVADNRPYKTSEIKSNEAPRRNGG